ncbi:hypothetical protein PR202_ga02264 [Eleusine coracana subsp. coracana]|uniref:RING-type domain-containing protein n=1 Tax=Eleusine coracana subsp. coracana TaxID=191504 RepID=A0AAV5BMC2_ELECO|nr:hypothetical protein PR202_ga02264 [Eleusine coracana subsp. coracana]
MGLMAGMLPGVECARRRRIRQGAAEAPCGTRRPSLCLYAAGGHDHAHLGSSKEMRSSACKEMMARVWTLDSNAREAKERLDQKLRSQRESVVIKRRQNTRGDGGGTSKNQSSVTTESEEEAPMMGVVLQREVMVSKTGSGGGAGSRRRRFMLWSRLGWRPSSQPEAEAEAEAEAGAAESSSSSSAGTECAVCLEELRAGDVLAHLPCAHRFHWACAVPWLKAASRCPVCRAQVQLQLQLQLHSPPTNTLNSH